jgi:hypothetical protein
MRRTAQGVQVGCARSVDGGRHWQDEAVIASETGVDADLGVELKSWIGDELGRKQIPVREEVMRACHDFLPLYAALPRQLIHRDMHLGNLLFEGGRFTGYLDFDISQKNVRIFDICYMGASMLVDIYKDEGKLDGWRAVFDGVLRGYEKAQPLTEAEKAAIPGMFIAIELIFTAFFSKIGQPGTAIFCAEMTNWLFDHQDRIKYRPA